MNTTLSSRQSTLLVILRMIIGWHFLYEGIAKMIIPGWTSAGYLQSAQWIFAPIFQAMARSAVTVAVVDALNIWGLMLIGIGLLLGVFTRAAGIAGIGLLAVYYISNPPFISTSFGVPLEGHYLFVNKTLVEMAALAVLVIFPTERYFSMDRFLAYWLSRRKQKASKDTEKQVEPVQPAAADVKRRELLKYLMTIPILGAFIYGTIGKYRWEKVNAITGATIKISDFKLTDLRGDLPCGEIKGKRISRIIAGGNLIGGWAHSRDLIYVPSLFKAYNTEYKVFETLQLAEKAGVNTINILYTQFPLINKYKRIFGSKLQTVSQIHPTKEDIYSHVDKVIDSGVDLIQIQGNCCDWRVRDGEMDVLAKCIDYIRKQGYPIGLGAHSIQALRACDEAGILPDFYMKTLHHDQYWSAHPKERRIPFSVDGERSLDHDEFHDNMFCLFADETIEFMRQKNIPFIAFKVLAGGAIHPKDGIRFAFENGADFVCIGMFDYQVVEDVNIALDILSDIPKRTRMWCA
ncbi:DoxX family membrane protein [bacterium]|nr:DoxX family membrane protein [bacterium]